MLPSRNSPFSATFCRAAPPYHTGPSCRRIIVQETAVSRAAMTATLCGPFSIEHARVATHEVYLEHQLGK